MIRNYFLSAIRSLWRNKLVTLINLLGMALGFGIFLSFWSWIRFDLSFDNFHEDIDHMEVLHVTLSMENSEYTSERTGGIYASLLPEEFPQLYSACRLSEPLEFELGVAVDSSSEGYSMKYFAEREVLAVDSTFLHYFSFPLLKGSVDEIFTGRDHMVITEEIASLLFGEDDPLGKQVRLGEGDYFTVVGVIKDPPENSSIQFRVLVGFHIMERMGYPVNSEGGTIYYSHFKMHSGADRNKLNTMINELIQERFDPAFDAHYFLAPFTSVYLHGETRGIIGLYLNLVMAIVVLSIAIINFINLTTAYSSGRLREISIRKSCGAGRRQLIFQFLGETYLLLIVALYLGLFLAEHLVPELSRTFDVGMDSQGKDALFWVQLFVLFAVTGLLAGLYPAVKISRLPGGRLTRGRLRKVLMVIQFSFSIIFIIVSVFTMKQYDYLSKADLGFNRDNVMYIRTTGQVWNRFDRIKDELQNLHFVEEVSTASDVPVMINNGQINWGEQDDESNNVAVIMRSDEDFLKTFEIDLREGSFFREGQDSLNSRYVVLNQSVVDVLGWEEALGHSFYLWDQEYTVLGVTDNIDFFPFNLELFDDRSMIYVYDNVQQYVFIRLQPSVSPEQLSKVEEIFVKHNPGYNFSYEFVSDYKYDAMDSADGIKMLFRLFSLVVVFIAIMGLVGLSIHNRIQRTKEVGIRKSMGAHSGNVLGLFLSDYVKLVAISNLIALPLGYLAVRQLLNLFSYHVNLSAFIFLYIALSSFAFALATVSLLALRTARSNPADSLRYE